MRVPSRGYAGVNCTSLRSDYKIDSDDMNANDQRFIFFFFLNQNTCTLEKTGHVSEGVYVLEVMLQDFPTKRIRLSNGNGTSKYWETSDENASPLCKLKLQFLLESKSFFIFSNCEELTINRLTSTPVEKMKEDTCSSA